MMKNNRDVERCVVCGRVIPEGRECCPACYGAAGVPTINDVFEAAKVIKAYCNSRNENEETDCVECPIKDICLNEPYLWEV